VQNLKDLDGKAELKLGLNGEVQYLNASLAVQIANYWIEQKSKGYFFKLYKKFANKKPIELKETSILIAKNGSNRIRKK